MKKLYNLFSVLIVTAMVLAACAPAEPDVTPAPMDTPVEPVAPPPDTPEPAATPEPVDTPEPAATPPPADTPEPADTPAPTGDVIFFSTQFAPVEEQARFRAILADGGFDFIDSEEGPLIDLVLAGAQAGRAEMDVIGALHGTFPPIEDHLINMIDIADDLMADREFVQAFLETGLLGTADYLYYIPWMQATYIMAAHQEALDYLPDGADLNALTWEQFAEWCQVLMDETGGPKCGLPHAGLFNRFLQGYLWPSFTGGMVTPFRSQAAADMLEWARDDLWPTIHPQSISYAFMQEPLLSREVWVAFDHTARLIQAFNEEPENFVGFPAPSGPAGLGYMPVIVGLAIPQNAPNEEGAVDLIEYLTRPEVQGRVLREMAFFPVVGGVDYTDLPPGVAREAEAVEAQSTAPNTVVALLPVGLGARGGEINEIFRSAFDRVVLGNEEIQTVLQQEGDNLQALMNETGAACWPPDPPSVGPCPVD
jgi:multiple sugar transport system substrate-binding protein